MSDSLTETTIHCPYCGESIHILVDASDMGSDYIEDCQVCCRPIEIRVESLGGEVSLNVRSENDTF